MIDVSSIRENDLPAHSTMVADRQAMPGKKQKLKKTIDSDKQNGFEAKRMTRHKAVNV
ncbi:MAG TPA: hypothetical protein PKV75_10320 [Desulfobacterales bacterium]|nr:hypothetical protein [Desulfobacterales bacterium]